MSDLARCRLFDGGAPMARRTRESGDPPRNSRTACSQPPPSTPPGSPRREARPPISRPIFRPRHPHVLFSSAAPILAGRCRPHQPRAHLRGGTAGRSSAAPSPGPTFLRSKRPSRKGKPPAPRWRRRPSPVGRRDGTTQRSRASPASSSTSTAPSTGPTRSWRAHPPSMNGSCLPVSSSCTCPTRAPRRPRRCGVS